jgi:adenosine deaminase
VTDELWRVHEHCNIDASQLREIALNGFRYAFLPYAQKQELLRSVLNDFPMPASKETPLW